MTPPVMEHNGFPSGSAVRRIVLLIVLMVIISSVLIVGTVVLAQQCQPSNLDNLSRFQNMPRDADGAIHVKVDYAGGTDQPNPTVKQAMQNAIAEWNSYSSITKVVFEPVTQGQQADLAFYHTNDSSLTGGCGKFSDASNRI